MIDKRIAINSVYLFLRMILVTGVTLYTSRVVLAELGVVDYGVYNVVAGVVSIISFLNTALANGYQRFFNIALGNQSHEDLQKCFSTSLLIQICVIIITLFLCESIGLWFLNHKMIIPSNRMFAANWVFQTSIIIFCFALIRVPFHAVIISFEKMSVFAYLSVVEVLLQLGLVYTLSFQKGDRLIAYGNLMTLLAFCVMLAYIFFAWNTDPKLKIIVKRQPTTLKEMLSFSKWNIFGSFAHVLRTNGLNVLLNMFFSPIINAANGFASQVSGAVTALSQNVTIASRPQVIKSYAQADYSKMLEITYTMSRYVFCLLWLMSFPLILNIKYVYSLWLGSETPEYTELFTILVLINNLIEAFASSLAALVHASGNMRKFQLLVSLTLISVIPISYFILKCGYLPQAVFYANIIISICAQLVRLILIRKIAPYFSIKEFYKNVIYRCMFLVLASILIIYPLTKYLFPNILGLLSLVVTIIVTAIIIFIIGLNSEERKRISDIIIR